VLDPDVMNFAGVMVVIVGSVAGLGATIALTTRWMRRSFKNDPAPRQLHDARLEQLQQSIDAIAIEVERIAEAQRFSVKLLAGRQEDQRLPR
jgi:hypothetical protein